MPVVIPEVVYVIGLFAALVGYLAARGLLATWTHSLGFLFQWMGAHLNVRIPIPHFRDPHIDLGGPFRAIDSLMVTALQTWAVGAEIEMGYCLHGLEKVFRYMAEAIDILARETTATFDWLVHVRLRDLAKALSLPVLLPLLLPKLLKSLLPYIGHGIVKIVHTVTHEVTHITTRVVRAAGAVVLPSPWALPQFRKKWHELEQWRKVTGWRLARLEGLLAASGLALAVAKLWGVRVSCMKRNGSIARFMRGICGLDKAILDLLLLGTVEAFIVTDLCGFTNLLMRATENVRPALLELVDAEDALIGCHGATKPLALALPPLSLPGVVGGLSLAA